MVRTIVNTDNASQCQTSVALNENKYNTLSTFSLQITELPSGYAMAVLQNKQNGSEHLKLKVLDSSFYIPGLIESQVYDTS